jgi:uncharacterized glyoxalase superfamily protein PhnB
MNDTATTTRQRAFAALAYQDAETAIDWLGRAFGFRQKFAAPDEDGKIVHAELEADGNIVMVGSTGVGLDIRSPRDLGGTTHCMYLVVDDPDAHHDRAREAGAEIVRELRDTDYGSREYVCRDPEGNLWSFGTYDPLA